VVEGLAEKLMLANAQLVNLQTKRQATNGKITDLKNQIARGLRGRRER